VPNQTILDIPPVEQAWMLSQLGQARYGYLLGLHILLLCVAGYTPTAIATCLFCSRSSVYRTVAAYRRGDGVMGWQAEEGQPAQPPRGGWQARLLQLLGKAPAVFGWCRTGWSCMTLALQLQLERGVRVSRETIRRALHQWGYAYKRVRHAALDNDPRRVAKLARVRYRLETLPKNAALFFADELDIHLLPKVGYAWMGKGIQTEVMTPGQNQKTYLAGAWNAVTGKLLTVTGEHKNRWLFIELLAALSRAYPATRYQRLYLVVDNYSIHKAKDVVHWLAQHPRVELLFLPEYCPKASPIEPIFGDIHDHCTRNHHCQQLLDLVVEVLWYVQKKGTWHYRLSSLYYAKAVTAAVKRLQKNAISLAA
jgi:transposase